MERQGIGRGELKMLGKNENWKLQVTRQVNLLTSVKYEGLILVTGLCSKCFKYLVLVYYGSAM